MRHLSFHRILRVVLRLICRLLVDPLVHIVMTEQLKQIRLLLAKLCKEQLERHCEVVLVLLHVFDLIPHPVETRLKLSFDRFHQSAQRAVLLLQLGIGQQTVLLHLLDQRLLSFSQVFLQLALEILNLVFL